MPAPPLANDRHIGRVIKDTYILEAKVGVGGFGAVYRARHKKLGSAVAMKFLLPHADDLARQRFEREARIAAAIVHPNVARVMDIDHDDEGSPYMVIEWIEGASLRALINDRGSISFPETVELFHQFGSAMDAAHGKGIVHRDLKPENLLLSEESGVVLLKVLDFGIARQSGSEGTLTHGVAIGTPCYMAPESARVGSASADRRVDIYAMGLLLYECLTGRRAIDGEPMQIFALQLTSGVHIPSVQEMKPHLPIEVDAVIARACAREPEDRYQSAGELAGALAKVPRPTVHTPPVLHGLPLVGVTSPGASLTPASLTSHLPASRSPQPTPLPVPYPAPLDSLPSVPAIGAVAADSLPTLDPLDSVDALDAEPADASDPEASLTSSELPHLDPYARPRRRRIQIAVAVSVLALAGGGVWFANTHDLLAVGPVDSAPTAGPPKPSSSSLVRWKLKGAPPGAKAFDLDHGGAAIAMEAGALLLPRGLHPVRLRLEAPGYQKIQMQVLPDSDGDIDFGSGTSSSPQ